MSAPTPAPGDDRPRDGYYPDPSIPGYVRYWNGAAWVPGTSRPAPSDGEPLAAPAGATPAPAPEPARTPAPASVEETGPVFLDEEPERYSDEPAAPEPATAWQADASRQTGFGGEQDRRVSWGTDPRVPAPQQQQERADGAVTNRPAQPEPPTPPTDGTVTFRRPTPPTDRPEGTMTMRALSARQVPGQQGPAVQGQQGQGQQVPGQQAQQAQAHQAQPQQPVAQHPQAAQQPVPQQPAQADAQPRSGSQPQPQPQAGFAPQGPAHQPQAQQAQAQQAQAHQAHAPQAAPLHPHVPYSPQAPTPAQQPQAGRPGAVPPQAAGAASGTPMTSGPGGGSPSWAQQVHQLAQPQSAQPARPAAGEPAEPEGPVTPWKPVANDPFLAAAQAQASARPAGLGKRLAARLIDSVVLGAVTAVAAVPLGTKAIDHIDGKIDAAKASGREATVWLLDGTTGAYLGIVLAVLLVAGVLYEALPTAKWGRTLGKKVCGLQVRDIEEHEAPTFGAALRRWLVYSVTGLLAIGVLGVLWCLFDRPWRQCWHDKAARTFVAG
ncbi:MULTISPECIES: RDD family protein [unclassified Streptomyces]|uniref:RDD family protein n=1 Tax=Streptomyces sp. NBC_00119 TaxID=2975659 RepID=A0AAU1UAB6_9ACTN|nr:MULTISPECIES: RDD family protein [unclassified Streptomyces]MCX4645165.1 RDD family protein [Streptomyces sp. NBC_01446]MCX5326067.1 RDD family protein [Streptomyces sp. NBC_00120]